MINDVWVPIGVRYGLPVQEFYSLNPAKLTRYQPYLLERLKHEKGNASEVGWINGLYVSRAIGGVLPKGRKYPDTPIELYDFHEDQDDDDGAEPFTDADRFAMFAEMFNKQSGLKSIEEKEAEERQSRVPDTTIGGGDNG